MAIQHSSSSLTWNCQCNPPNPRSPFNAFYFPLVPPPFSTPSPFTTNAQQLLFSLPPAPHALLTSLLLRNMENWGGKKIHSPAQCLNAFHPSSTSEVIELLSSSCSSTVCLDFFLSLLQLLVSYLPLTLVLSC